MVLSTFGMVMAGCGDSVPSESDGRRAIRDRIESAAEGRIRMVSFRKTNGVLGEVLGVATYQMEYELTIEFAEDCKWLTGSFGVLEGFRTLPATSNGHWGDNFLNPGYTVKEGQQVVLAGKMSFERADRGWRDGGQDLELRLR